MRAVVWQGPRTVSVEDVPDPGLREPTDALVRVTSTSICGSDLLLHDVLSPFMSPGDVLGHEAVGVVEEVGPEVGNLSVGDRVVIPFQIACGHCFMCGLGLPTQCETTQVRDQGMGAALFGYSRLYGGVPGAQAKYLRVPQAQFTHIKVPHGPPDERYVYLSDVLPTAWQAIEYAQVPPGGTVLVLGLGPIGAMTCRIALHRNNCRVLGIDLRPDRLATARAQGVEVIDLREHDDGGCAAVRDATHGRGADSVVDAVGMEAHGPPVAPSSAPGPRLPAALAGALSRRAGVDRRAARYAAIDLVRRGGTVSVVGVYGGLGDPLPLLTVFDKQLQLRMGQANVKRWADDILPLLGDDDPLGTETFATHRLPLEQAPQAYETMRRGADGMAKVVLRP